MTSIQFQITEQPLSELQSKYNIIQTGLDAFNQTYISEVLKDLSIFAENDSKVIGGAILKYSSEAVYLKLLWIDHSCKREGLGSKIISLIEEFAHTKNLKKFFVDTYEFQAVEFYKKQGFQVIGTIPDYIFGHGKVFFRKNL